MPKNKNAYARYRVIDEALNNQKFVTIEQLMQLCERHLDTSVGKRTIEKDIADLRDDFDAPIDYNFYEKAYQYKQPFSLQTVAPLTKKEIKQLKLAVATLQQFAHLEAFSGLQGALDKIEKAVKYKNPEEAKSAPHIHFEQVPVYEGTQHIAIILSAIESSQVLSFSYHSYKSDESVEHKVYPYLVKEQSLRWYLIAYNPLFGNFTTYALDRFSCNPVMHDEYFERDANFYPSLYFQNTYGIEVRIDLSVQKIILLFEPLQGKYFMSKPFSIYTVLDESPKGLTVQLELRINYELIRKIASMGMGVKVLYPNELVSSVKKYHADALKLYGE